MHHLSTMIDGARQRINQHWVTGSEAKYIGGGVYGYCLLGGLGAVVRESKGYVKIEGDVFRDQWQDVNARDDLADSIKLINRAIRRCAPFGWLWSWLMSLIGVYGTYGWMSKRARIALWNDTFARKSDVLKVLDQAIIYALKHEKKEAAQRIKRARLDESRVIRVPTEEKQKTSV